MNFDTICNDLAFPEGPIWLADGTLIVVEIERRCLTHVMTGGRRRVVAQLGGGPNGAAIGPDGAIYICNNGGAKFAGEGGHRRVVGQADDYSGGRIERVDFATGKWDVLYTHCNGIPLKGPNDIVFDRHGNFYFTDLGKTRQRDRDRGGVYYARPDGSAISEIIFPLSSPNGIGLSPDGTTLYVAETETGRLWRWAVTGPGEIEKLPYPSLTSGTLVFNASNAQRFDSLALEASGRICLATLGDGGITSVTPEGIADFVALPDRQVTNICFGGADMKSAFITLSATGRLIRIDWPRPGLASNFR